MAVDNVGYAHSYVGFGARRRASSAEAIFRNFCQLAFTLVPLLDPQAFAPALPAVIATHQWGCDWGLEWHAGA